MFYSHEVLTSRKYGVATVWLVATLGSRSSLKKVSRKAILDVNVAKACETILEPEAPMALRLQSNLLYGVTRVYLQQCGYVLADVESANLAMRHKLRAHKMADLEAEGANRVKFDQLVLEDDPNFMPELDLMPIDLNDLTLSPGNDDMQSYLSPYGSSQTIASEHSIGGLRLPSSNNSFIGGPGGGFDMLSPFEQSGSRPRHERPQLLEDNLGLMIGPDDDFVMEDAPFQQPVAPSDHAARTDVGNVADAAKVQSDQHSDQPIFGQPDEDGFVPLQDSSVFATHHGAVGEDDMQHETTSETAVASMAAKQRQPRNPKVLPLDQNPTLSNRVLAGWATDYVNNMRDEMHSKHAYKLAALAKKNAAHWVLGAGTILGQGMRGPLDMFSGAAILEAFTGINLLTGVNKRAREDIDESENGRRVRHRGDPSSDPGAVDIEFQDGAFQSDGFMPNLDDDTIEQGREAPTPLDDRHLSSIFPWNQSAGSRRPTDAHPTSASIGGGGPQLNFVSRRGSRLTSASPLIGHGAIATELHDDFHLPDPDTDTGPIPGSDEFELFGPAAQVDTQTAAQSQWQRAALGSENANFLTFVQTAIEDADELREDVLPGGEVDTEMTGTIEFEELLPPKENSQIVAAQALLHVLTLATKDLIKVEQEELFGAINIRVI